MTAETTVQSRVIFFDFFALRGVFFCPSVRAAPSRAAAGTEKVPVSPENQRDRDFSVAEKERFELSNPF